MKVYISHSTAFDFGRELYTPLKKSTLSKEHQFIFPHRSRKSISDSKDLIRLSDAVLAEVSYPSTGSGIELGWAQSLDIPIVCIFKKGAAPSSSLNKISQILLEYTTVSDLVERLSKVFKELAQ